MPDQSPKDDSTSPTAHTPAPSQPGTRRAAVGTNWSARLGQPSTLTRVCATGDFDLRALRSPKLTGSKAKQWYRYYAGFSPDFVRDCYRALNLRPDQRVLDPWMGSGTTLSVVAGMGSPVSGLDLNPAMSVIAKGRLLAKDTEGSIEPLANEILKHWRPARLRDTDLLSNWYTAETASLIRGLVNRIDTVLVLDQPNAIAKTHAMTSLAAFFYVAAFEVSSSSLKAYSSRNPTWVKRGASQAGEVSLMKEDIKDSFLNCVRRLQAHIQYNVRVSLDTRNQSVVDIGDSRAQPFGDASCDAAITSPPYLTRLDYVVGHLPELALLGLTESDIADLRRRMIGTPTMTAREQPYARLLGPKTEELLDTISTHESYASASYYAPNFRQYFEGMRDSLCEMERVCRPGSPVAMVVQDSRYKDVHIDLATALRDMTETAGWTFHGQRDYVSVRSIAQLNTRAHEQARTNKPIESVLVLKTPA